MAVGIFNRGLATKRVSVRASDLKLSGNVTARDLWSHKAVLPQDGTFSGVCAHARRSAASRHSDKVMSMERRSRLPLRFSTEIRRDSIPIRFKRFSAPL